MKKLICIFTACLSFFIFYLTFSVYGEYERNNMDEFIFYIKNQTQRNEYGYQINMKNMEQDIKDIQQFAKDNDYLVYIGNPTLDGMTKILSHYIYDYDDSHLQFNTIYGKKLSFSKDSKYYFSTSVLDKNCYDHIDFVDKRNEKSYQNIVRLYPLSQYSKRESYTQHNNLFLFTNLSQQEHDKLIKNSKINNLIEERIEPSEFPQTDENNVVVLEIMMVCGISICLLFIAQSIKNAREIIIRRMMGANISFITKQLMLKQIICYVLVYLVVQIICYLVVIRNIRVVTIPFILILIKYLMIFISFLIIIYGIMYLYIKKSNKFVHLKSRGQVKAMNWITSALKFMILLLILPTFLQFSKQGWVAVSEYWFLHTNRDEISNQLYLDTTDDRQREESEIETSRKIYKKINTFLEEHGAIYQDFGSYESIKMIYEIDPDDEWNQNCLPYIVVNRKYLEQYEIKAIDGSIIDLDNIKKETMFVPEDSEQRKEDLNNYCSGDCDVVSIKKGNTFWNMSVNTTIRSLQDPLIVYSPNIRYTMGVDSYRLNASDKLKQELVQYIKDAQIDKEITLRDTSHDYDIMISQYQDHLLYLLPLFVTYIFVILIFIYQSAYLYFNDHKQRFVLGYLMGKSFLSRHGDMIYQNIIVYVPMVIILYFIINLSFIEAIMSVLGLMLFELVCDYIMIHQLEKRYMIEILKGD